MSGSKTEAGVKGGKEVVGKENVGFGGDADGGLGGGKTNRVGRWTGRGWRRTTH